MLQSASLAASTALLAVALGACKTSPTAPAGPPVGTSPPHADQAPAHTAAEAGPSSPPSGASVAQQDVITTARGNLEIAPLQHATMLLRWAGMVIYVDPVPDAGYQGLPAADVIIITDIHQDHLSQATVLKLKKHGTKIVVPDAVSKELPASGVVVVANGARAMVEGIGVEAVPMYNLTRGPDAGLLYHDKGRGNGYVLTFANKRVYVSGDTECTPEMKSLRDIDVAFVCMNLPYTMPPSEAVACIAAFRPKILYPYHYRGSNLAELEASLGGSHVEVRVRNWYP